MLGAEPLTHPLILTAPACASHCSLCMRGHSGGPRSNLPSCSFCSSVGGCAVAGGAFRQRPKGRGTAGWRSVVGPGFAPDEGWRVRAEAGREWRHPGCPVENRPQGRDRSRGTLRRRPLSQPWAEKTRLRPGWGWRPPGRSSGRPEVPTGRMRDGREGGRETGQRVGRLD